MHNETEIELERERGGGREGERKSERQSGVYISLIFFSFRIHILCLQ